MNRGISVDQAAMVALVERHLKSEGAGDVEVNIQPPV
jgi:hypothetical protein